jgi:hypothetical protein
VIRNTLFSTAIGLLLGFALVWWVEPNGSGAVFLVVLAALACNVMAVVLQYLGTFVSK